MVLSEEEYNKKHRRYRLREMGPYQWEEEIKVGYFNDEGKYKRLQRKRKKNQPKMTIVGGTGKIVKEKIKDS